MASIKPDVKVSKIFKEDNFAACIHANVAEILFTKEECIKENSSQTRCKVVVTDAKQHLAISFDGNTHGLIFANIARGAKRGRCLRCQSIRCPHIQAWNLELKKVLINVTKVDSEAGTCDRENEGSIVLVDVNNENVNEEDFEDFLEEDESDVAEPTPTKKLMYPFQEDVQEKLRILDSSDLSDVTTFISFPADDGHVHMEIYGVMMTHVLTIGSRQTRSKLRTQRMSRRRKGNFISEGRSGHANVSCCITVLMTYSSQSQRTPIAHHLTIMAKEQQIL